MAGSLGPSDGPTQGALICPKCGAPLPRPGWDTFVTCDYCGVRTDVSKLLPPPPEPAPSDSVPSDSYLGPEDGSDDFRWWYRPHWVLAAVLVIVLIITIGIFASQASQPPSNTGPSTVASCSVSIAASATTGPAPFTANFTAEISTPAGDSAGTPMWQFGPFLSGLDLNYTYGSPVSHTWDTNGTFGVHVSVPDSSLEGCWNTTTVDVT